MCTDAAAGYRCRVVDRRAWFIAGLLCLAAVIPVSRADTVASLLGNFTINQFCGIELDRDAVRVHFAVVYGQLPALSELHRADSNGDGVTSQAERDAYVAQLAPQLATQLHLTVDGNELPLQLVSSSSSLPTEQGGFSLRVDAELLAILPASLSTAPRALALRNDNFAGRFGWHEMAIATDPAIHVFNTDGFSTSLTAGLTQALQSLPPTGPLDERSVHLAFSLQGAPEGAVPLAPRPEVLQPGRSTASGSSPGESVWLQTRTRALVDLISAPQVSWHIMLWALLAAMILGALHAFSPGHGKTIVGAYLVGSRGTPRHAAFLGLTVTVTHTIGVFALGLLALFASRYIVPEKLFPILSLLSGLIVLAMGIILLAQRWHSLRHARTHGHDHDHDHDHDHHHDHHDHDHDHDHDHHHEHDHHHADGHAHSHEAGWHSHGGRAHSHLPAGDATGVSWRSLLALGISGGLIPCPSALVLLLAAVALHKTAYGILLVVSFSIGLAVTLTGVGLAFLYAGTRLQRRGAGSSWWLQAMPVASAAAITVVGAILCFGALQSARI